MAEKRESPRVETLHLISLERVEESDISAPEVGRTLDVSSKGVRVETAREIEIGQEIELDIAVGDRLISARGRVVHSDRSDQPHWVTGLEFLEISDEDLAFLLGRRD